MTFNEYLKASEKTERKFPDGLTLSGDTVNVLRQMIEMSINYGLLLNEFKKHVIYGAPLDAIQDRVMLLSELQSSILEDRGNTPDITLDSDSAEMLHAMFGVITEAAEIAPLLMSRTLHGDDLSTEELEAEIGDIHWYLAILYRLFGMDEGDIRQKNINKLKARFPDKFDANLALNRNLEAESEAMKV